MITIKEMLGDISDIYSMDEFTLVKISDKLWEIGKLEEIKEKVSPDLFNLFIGMNVIGNWKEGGWWYIICEMGALVPYIPMALENLCLTELKTAFENIIKIFPEYTVFDPNNETYCDIVNFLQNTRFKVQDERLNNIDIEKRKEMVTQVRQNLKDLEHLTEPLLGEHSEYNGWKPILDYIANRV